MAEPWQPSASLAALRARARLLQQIRGFFDERGVLEVDTPVLAGAPVTDPRIDAFSLTQAPLYLQTSPEYAMKRLLAAGSGPIYQLGKVFRRGESGRRHNPEFTLLEWYRPGFSLDDLIDEVLALLAAVLGQRACRRVAYGELFEAQLGVDVFSASEVELASLARERAAPVFDQADRDTWLQLLFSHVIEPQLGLGEFCVVRDFPASQAALARLGRDAKGREVARRFEVFVEGVELANGYHELTDAAEQARRFEEDCLVRLRENREVPPVDRKLLAALEAGLPDCAGVALGVDRLLMLQLGVASIGEVLAFPVDRA